MAVIFFILVSTLGCGSSSTTSGAASSFVFTGSNQEQKVGAVAFNFIRPQQALNVPTDTVRLGFRFFVGPGGTSTLLQEEFRDYADSITIEGVSAEVVSVVVTAFTAQGPVVIANANITIEVGGTIVVDFANAEVDRLTTLTVTPDGDSVAETGTIAFSASGFDQNGDPFTLAPGSITWGVTGTAASIDSSTGVATGLSVGTATITATVGTFSDDATLNVVPNVATSIVSVLPNPLALDLDPGTNTGTLTTTGGFAAGPDRALTNAQDGLTYMVTGNPGVATVDNAGLVTAVAQGSTTVTASVGALSTPVTVNVDFGAAGNVAHNVTLDAAALSVVLNDPPVAAFPGATVTDPTQASFVNGALTIAATGNTNVMLTVPTTPAIGTITNNGSNSVSIALNGQATPANVQTVLQGTTISVTQAGAGMVEVGLNDGLGTLVTANRGFSDAPPNTISRIADNGFTDITGVGGVTTVLLSDDELSAPVPLNFNFTLYGNTESAYSIHSNGFLTSEPIAGLELGGTIPDVTNGDRIAAYWDDLDPGDDGALVHVVTQGTAPNRRTTFQFEEFDHFPGDGFPGGAETFQIVLFETTNVIEFHYQATTEGGVNATVGLQNNLGTQSVLWLQDGVPAANSIVNGMSLRFTP